MSQTPSTPQDHAQSILDQFTRQAAPFARKEAMSKEQTLQLLVSASGVGPDDVVLDVACGPGLTGCALAAASRHVTGIDIVPAMLEQARARQQEKRCANITWQQGDVTRLPYMDASFSLVFTRYSLHHMLEPAVVLAEMVRVCRPAGHVVVADMFTFGTDQDAMAFNVMEQQRDPSHTRALPLGVLYHLAQAAGLQDIRMQFYRADLEVQTQLRASFPPTPEHAERFRQTVRQDIDRKRLGIAAYLVGDELHYSYPTVILTGHKPG